jgi:hypothetical protein
MARTNFVALKSIDQVRLDLHSELERLEQALRNLELNERPKSALPVALISHPNQKHHCSVRQSQY